MAIAVEVSSEYRNLPVAQLQESTTNPRRRFDERSLAELATSFTAQKVLQPLLVRSIDDDKYEVIAGARRLRAAKLAALETVPVRVVELSDAAARESQLSENLLREDVHPYEEALALSGFLHLEGAQYDVARLAARFGKSPQYITTRIRLTKLESSIAEAFLADQIGVGHALEIAKLPQSEQQRAFDACFRALWSDGKQTRVLLPVRELKAWIEQNILLSLDSVPFDKNDETLVPEAGSCAECPKRTGFNTLLFGEAVRDSCTDGNCFNRKLTECIERQVAEKPQLVRIASAWGATSDPAVLGRNRYVALQLGPRNGKSKAPLSPAQKPCKQMAEAIVVDGAERGHIVKVCADTTCSVHFADRHAPNPEQLTKQREQRRKEMEKQKLAITIRHRTLAEILKKVSSPLEKAGLALVAATLIAKLEPLCREALTRRHKLVEGKPSEVTHPQVQKALAGLLRRSDESALSKLLVEIALLEAADRGPNGASGTQVDVLMVTAKQYDVEVDKLAKTVEKEFAAKRTKQTARQNKEKNKVEKKAATAA
jgi:ParB family chromosome partitioning protein